MEPLSLCLATLAAVGLIGVGVVAPRRRRHPATGGSALAGLSDREFESLVIASFSAQGYQPIDTPQGKLASVGQLLLRRERSTFLVEYRHWRDRGKVSVDAVQALRTTMATRGASAGFMLAGGRFSREAVAFAGSCGIRLLDGPAVQAIVRPGKAR